jgi:hypothetical protein
MTGAIRRGTKTRLSWAHGTQGAAPVRSQKPQRGLDAVGEDLYVEFAFAGAVEFGEENALPAAEGEFAFFDEDELCGAGEHGFDVRVRIAFGVAVWPGGGNQAIEGAFGIGGDVGVAVFVDENGSSGVGDIEEAGTDADAESGDDALNVAGYVDELSAARSFDRDGLHEASYGILAVRVREEKD